MTAPRHLYNCDKSFLPLDGSREKGVESKCAYGPVSGTTEHITLPLPSIWQISSAHLIMTLRVNPTGEG